jgi:hypothetical protein
MREAMVVGNGDKGKEERREDECGRGGGRGGEERWRGEVERRGEENNCSLLSALCSLLPHLVGEIAMIGDLRKLVSHSLLQRLFAKQVVRLGNSGLIADMAVDFGLHSLRLLVGGKKKTHETLRRMRHVDA